MKQIRQVGVILVVGLWIVLALAACGEEEITAEEHFQKGNEFAQAGNYEQAIEEYKAVLELEQDNVSAMTNLGVAYYSVGQLDEAIAQYERALEISPQDADVHSNLAAAYLQTGNLNKAQQEYQTAVDLKPDLVQAWFGLGVIYVQLGQNDQAIEAFEAFQEYDTGEDAIASSQAQEYLKQLRGD